MSKTAIVLTLFVAGGALLTFGPLPALAGAALAATAVALAYRWKV